MQEPVGLDLIIGFFHFGGSGAACGLFVLPGDCGVEIVWRELDSVPYSAFVG